MSINKLFITLLLFISSTIFAESFEINDLGDKEVVDFFSSNNHIAVVAKTEESTMLGKKLTHYIYLSEKWIGPYHNVLDILISPSGDKEAVVYMKEGDQDIFVDYAGSEFILDIEYLTFETYSRFADNKPIGFIDESFFIAPVKEDEDTTAYLENEKLYGIDPGIGSSFTSSTSRILFSDDNSYVVLQNNFLDESTVVYIYPDGKISSFNPEMLLKGIKLTYYDPRGHSKGTPEDYTDCFIEAGVKHEDQLLSVNGLQFSSTKLLKDYYENQEDGPIEFIFLQDGNEITVNHQKGIDELGQFDLEVENRNKRVPGISNMLLDNSTGKVFIDFNSMEIKPFFLYGEEVIERFVRDSFPTRPHEYRFTPYTNIPYLIYRDLDDNLCIYFSGEKTTGPPISRGSGKWEYGWDVSVSDDGETIIWFIPDGRTSIVRMGTQEVEDVQWYSMSDDGKSLVMQVDNQLIINGEIIGRMDKILQDNFSSAQTFSLLRNQKTFLYHNGVEYDLMGVERNYPEFVVSSGGKTAWRKILRDKEEIMLNGEVYDYFTKTKSQVRWLNFLEDETLAVCVMDKSNDRYYLWRNGEKIGPFESDDLIVNSSSDGSLLTISTGESSYTESSNKKDINYRLRSEHYFFVEDKSQVFVNEGFYPGRYNGGSIIYWDGEEVHSIKN